MKFNNEQEREIWLFNRGARLQQHEPELLQMILKVKNLPTHIKGPLKLGRDQYKMDKAFVLQKLDKNQQKNKLKMIREFNRVRERDEDLER